MPKQRVIVTRLVRRTACDIVTPATILDRSKMHLSKFSDYSLRVLLLAGSRPDSFFTVNEAAAIYGISQAHLKKVVRLLAGKGYLLAVRGHGGGFRLGRPAHEINLGTLLRDTEPDFALVECYRAGGACLISHCCRLPHVLDQAMAGFLAVMERHSLQDVLLAPRVFGLADPAAH